MDDVSKKEAAVTASIQERADWLCTLSDAIWDRPELAFREYFAAETLTGALEQEGFAVERGLVGIPTAFSGRFGSGSPVIAILGEYDALAGMSQQADAAEPIPIVPGGSGHGCGHHLLGVGALGAAIAMKDFLQARKLPGTVLYIGCPAEEGGSGKAFLVRGGAFAGVDCALTWHPGSFHSALPRGSLANRQILYTFHGVSAHAASYPERGRSALDALTLMNTGVQFLREHVPATTRIHYAVTDTGGTAPNVVQSTAAAVYLIRTPSVDTLPELTERVNKVARGAAMMTETEVTIAVQKGCANMIPNPTLCEVLRQNLEQIPKPVYSQAALDYARRMRQTIPTATAGLMRLRAFGPEYAAFAEAHMDDPIYNVAFPEAPVPITSETSTDVGDVSWVCPTAKVQICCVCAGTAGHTWQRTAQGKSELAHKGMLYAAKVLSGAGIDLLTRPELVAKAKADWTAQLRGRVYRPLPPEIQPW